jgi:hypothetical protein
MPVSPAGRDRAARTDRALDEDRRGRDRNIRAADERLPDARDRLGDTPNTNPGRVQAP